MSALRRVPLRLALIRWFGRKRQSTAALDDLSELGCAADVAKRRWSAAILCRFRLDEVPVPDSCRPTVLPAPACSAHKSFELATEASDGENGGRRGALSSVVEHFLHTEGVAGSKPAARTIFSERNYSVFSVQNLVFLRASGWSG